MGFELLDAVILRHELEKRDARDEAEDPKPCTLVSDKDAHCIRTLLGKKAFVDHDVIFHRYFDAYISGTEGDGNLASFLTQLKLFALTHDARQVNVALSAPLRTEYLPEFGQCGYKIRLTNVYRLELPIGFT